MKLPRDISGLDLVHKLRALGYVKTRQSGSHIRATTQQNGEHHITIPSHNPLKIGTLSSVLSDVAAHFDKTKEEILKLIFD
jgi:predicted RNA binding protein YcfA (HicA-like mRNA interferase family)